MLIPEVRDELRALAYEMLRVGFTKWSNRIMELERELYRRKAQKSGREPSPRMTDELRAEIVRMKRRERGLTHHEIAAALKINSGRVSETLRGKRR